MCVWKEEGKECEASKSKKQNKKKNLKEVGNLCTYERYLNILNLQYETIGSR